MIVVRNVFRLKFGKAKEAIALWKESLPKNRKLFPDNARLLTDVVGPFYTLVFEFPVESMSAYEEMGRNVMDNADWQNWYQRFTPLVESGYREIYSVVS